MKTLSSTSVSKIAIISFLFIAVLTITGCTSSELPMTDNEMAEKYGMTTQEFKEQKSAAARMNMNIEDHLSGSGMDDMDM